MLFGDIVFILMILCIFVIPFTVGIIVYLDAKNRGLSPWLWAFVSAVLPCFIGTIIYLIVRNDNLVIQGAVCDQCKNPVKSDWKICPVCENELTENNIEIKQIKPMPFKWLLIVLGIEVAFPLLAMIIAIIKFYI